MTDICKGFVGQEVAVVLRVSMPSTIIGRLEALDEHFVRLEQRNDRGSILIPTTSVLHITETTSEHDD